MWTGIAFWYCIVWGVLIAGLMLRDVHKGDLGGFIAKGVECAGLVVTVLVLAGVLS